MEGAEGAVIRASAIIRGCLYKRQGNWAARQPPDAHQALEHGPHQCGFMRRLVSWLSVYCGHRWWRRDQRILTLVFCPCFAMLFPTAVYPAGLQPGHGGLRPQDITGSDGCLRQRAQLLHIKGGGAGSSSLLLFGLHLFPAPSPRSQLSPTSPKQL